MADQVSRCLVYCRLRPSNAKDFEDGGYKLVTLEKKRVAVKDERHYDFDGTFDDMSKQEDVFDTIAVPCLNHALNGFCSALMCYGQTGTGKSFTMCCTKKGLEGIIPRSATYLFDFVKRDTSKVYTVTGQFIQIYRDQLGDLMTEGGRDKVDIHFEKDTGVTLSGSSSHVLTSEEDFMSFYDTGNSRRVTTATAMNPESSRGHSAMIIIIESHAVNDESSPKIKGKITFIDLAGYERFSKTGISNSNPVMKDEAKTINASLLSLGHVVSALSNGDKHIPWRNSKLTRLLQDSIGGRSRTSIILTIGPSSESLHETTNSLQFGQRAMAVKVTAKVNVTTDYEKLAVKLQALLAERDEQINLLEIQIRSRDAERAEVAERYQRDEEELRERFKKEIEELKQKGGSAEQFRKAEDVFLVEVENLKEQQLEEVQYQEEAHNKQIVSLAAEQQRRERKKQVELQVSQERLIAEFERKINFSGENEELISALKQLSEKDSILASRASTIADLQERIADLTSLLSSKGIAAPEFAPLEETFIDLTQLDEIQKRLETEVEYQKNVSVGLRAQLEASNEQLEKRASEVVWLHEELDRYQRKLQQAGVDGDDGCSPVLAPRGFVDVESIETLKVFMQETIDTLQNKNKELEEQLSQMRSEQIAHSDSVVNHSPETPRIGRARAMSRVDGSRGLPRRADTTVENDREKKFLLERNTDLEKRLINLSREYNLALAQIDSMKDTCKVNGIIFDSEVNPAANEATRIMESLLTLKDDEVSRLLEVLKKREELFSEAQVRVGVESESRKQDYATSQHLLESFRSCSDTLLTFVTESRNSSREFLFSLCQGSQSLDFVPILERKDSLLSERERNIAEKELLLGRMASVVFSLKSKLEELGEVVEISDDMRSAIDTADRMHAAAVRSETIRIEEDLKRQLEEKERLQSVLKSISDEREKDSQAIASAKQELEQRVALSNALQNDLSLQREALTNASVDTQSLMGLVVDLKEKLSEKERELAHITHLMMQLQAEKGASEGEGLIAIVKRKFRDK